MMTQAIEDDTAVKQLCERLGCWGDMVESMAAGQSGVLAVNRWTIGYFADGLIAIEYDSPLEAGLMAEYIAQNTIYRDGGTRRPWREGRPHERD